MQEWRVRRLPAIKNLAPDLTRNALITVVHHVHMCNDTTLHWDKAFMITKIPVPSKYTELCAGIHHILRALVARDSEL